MFDKVRDYIVDKEFRLTLYEDKVHVINYSKILSLEEAQIIFLAGKKKIILQGNHLYLSRLLDEEVLIQGEVIRVEVSYV